VKIQTACILILFAVLAALPAHAQTTVVNFDSPACKANTNPGTYQGINFSTGTPWDCESSGYAGASGLSLSWTQNIQSGTFKFVSPAVLNSFLMATSIAGSTLKVSTDQGETVTVLPSNKWVTFSTGFTKPATTVTVDCTCGWTLEMDNITYTVSTVTPPPPTITGVVASCAPAAIASTATSQCTAVVTGTGTFSKTVTWSTSDGTITAAGVLTPSGTATSAAVKAISTQDPTKSGSFAVAITLPPPPPVLSFTITGLPALCTLVGGTLTCSNVPAPTTLALSCSATSGATCSVTAPTITISLATTTGGGHTATLSWTASTSPVAGYRVYRSATSGTYAAPLNSVLLTVTTYTDATVQPGAKYFYVATAVDAGGNESLFSNEVSAAIPTP
jgi:hypothetical protein